MKTHLLIIALVLLSLADYAQTTAIPDANFEQALIDLGIDSNGLNGNILNTDAVAVTGTLDVFNKNISDLTGIEAFKEITTLGCSFNNLTTLDLSSNPLLTLANCGYNNLTSINLSNCTLLTSLDCYGNNLTSIDVSNNAALISLRVIANDLASLNVSNNISLTELYVGLNQLSSLDISQNILLTELSVENNQLTSLDVSQHTLLSQLNVKFNQLTSLNVRNGNNINFTTFDARVNPNLACIEVDDIAYSTTNWTLIDAASSFSENCNAYVPDDNFEQALIDLGYDTGVLDDFVPIANIEVLTTLDVSNKNIADLTGIEDFVFLENLNCSSNQLTSLDISQNTALTQLNVSNNLLTSLNTKNGNYANFTAFDATNNPNLTCILADDAIYSAANWTNIDGASSFSKDCSLLGVTTNVPDDNFEQALIDLGYDDVLDNNVATANINSITSLFVAQKNIADLTGIEDFVALTSLSCFENQLTSLDISNNTSLITLVCTTNQLTNIDLSNNTALQQLDIRYNNLTSIDLSQNTLLYDVEVNNNQLTSLDVSNLPDLLHVYFQNNQLIKLNVKNGNNGNITSFDATGNPNLDCIEVDDAAYSTTNWTNIDAGASFSTDCQYDDDGDGVTNAQEVTDATDPNDGCDYLLASQVIANVTVVWNNLDCDGDGVSNGVEITDATDIDNGCSYLTASQVIGNVTATWNDLDCDGDGVTNGVEVTDTSDPEDGCSYVVASQVIANVTTEWNDLDCDGDGVSNGIEITDTTDPENGCSYLVANQIIANVTSTWNALDCDGDGVTNGVEITDTTNPNDGCDYLLASQVIGNVTSVWNDLDCDGDGVTNGVEITDTTDPEDGCSYLIVNQVIGNVTSTWNNLDCDGDGVTNGIEITDTTDPENGCSYLEASQIIANVTSTWNALDCDGDGVTNGVEITDATDPKAGCSYLVANQIIGNVTTTWNSLDCDCDGTTNGDEIINGTDVFISAPTGSATQSFCVADNATVAQLAATGTNIQWYAAATGGSVLSTTVVLTDATTYYASQMPGSCESDRLEVTVTLNNPTIPTGLATQSYCSADNPTIAELAATGTNIQWYSASTGGSALASTDALTDATTYYASQTIGSCESGRFEVTVVISNVTVPTGSADQSFCPNNNSTITNLEATGTNIQWYAAATGGTALATNVALTDATNYYASQTENGCESERLEVLVSINIPPAPTGSFTQNFCIYNNATVADLEATGTNIVWYNAASGGDAFLSMDVLVGGNYYASQIINGCDSYRMEVVVVVTDPELPSSTATQSFCLNSNPTVADLVATATGTDISWYADAIGGTALSNDVALTSANYYVGQTINNCESPRLEVVITVNDTPTPTANATQSFCNGNSPSVADLVATGTTIQWYTTTTGGTALATTDVLTDATSYFGSQIIDGCESDRVEVVVMLNNPAIPTGESTQAFCDDNNPTITDLEVTGTNIQWYESMQGGSPLSNETELISTDYFASQKVDNCESERLQVAVTVDNAACETVLGLNQWNKSDITIYPTPTTGDVYINLGEQYTDVRLIIRNIEGSIIEDSNYYLTNEIKAQIKGSKGVYLIQLIQKNGSTLTYRIIKK